VKIKEPEDYDKKNKKGTFSRNFMMKCFAINVMRRRKHENYFKLNKFSNIAEFLSFGFVREKTHELM